MSDDAAKAEAQPDKMPVRQVLYGVWLRRDIIKREIRRLFKEGPAKFHAAPKETKLTVVGILTGFAAMIGLCGYQLAAPRPPAKPIDFSKIEAQMNSIGKVAPQLQKIQPNHQALDKALQQQPPVPQKADHH